MSWDIVLFNSKEKINSVADIDELKLEPTDFCSVLEKHFNEIIMDGNHREIKGSDYTIDFFVPKENASNTLLNLYGENGLYELVQLARQNNWQIYDTGLGEMIDLDNPSNNGYKNFQTYLEYIRKKEN